MALVSFAVIEISGMRALGLNGYLGTIFFLPAGLPTLLKPVMLGIMTPIEIIRELAKPFALAGGLFGTPTAGPLAGRVPRRPPVCFPSHPLGVAGACHT